MQADGNNVVGIMYADEDVYSKTSDLPELPAKKKLYFSPTYFEPENLQVRKSNVTDLISII